MDYDMREIGAAMRRAREKKELSSSALAQKAGVSIQSLWNYESGNRQWPGLYNLLALADVLEISLDELVGRSIKQSVK